MGRRLVYPLLLLLLMSAMLLLPTSGGGDSITVFAGSAVKPALEEAAEVFEAQSGTGVELHFGGSGRMLSQLKLSGRGDVYLAGSPEFMNRAIEEGAVVQPKRLVYLVPAIIVREDSNITGLDALAREGVRVGIADPRSVSVGRYAAEIITHSGYDIKKNVVSEFESAAKTTSALLLGSVDATINWRVTASWNPGLRAVPIKPEYTPRVSVVTAAIGANSRNRESARAFIDFLTSRQGAAIFEKHGYIIHRARALEASNKSAVVGGEPVFEW